MIPASNPHYRETLAQGVSAYARVEVWRGGIQVEELTFANGASKPTRGAPVFLGNSSIRATLTSRVVRTLSLSVPSWLYPWDTSDLLNPYGQVLKVFQGVRYGSGDLDEFPTFVGPILEVTPQGNGVALVSAGDLATDVVLSDATAPTLATTGAKVTSEIKRLITDASPLATFGRFDAIGTKVPEGLSYDVDRGGSLDGLAKVAGAFWYALADGRFVVRFIPWTVPIVSTKLPMTNVGGSLLTAFPARSRSGVFSRVTVTSESNQGGPPLFATAQDTDPASPTYINGAFGVKSTQLRITQAGSQGACLAAAKAALGRSKALTQSWKLTATADPSLELGDALAVQYRDEDGVDRYADQIIAGFQLPLDPGRPMSIDGRDPQAVDLTT